MSQHLPVAEDVIGAVEREQVARDLTRHCGDGRLTLDELTERLAAAEAATTRTELDELLRDLPPTSAPPIAAEQATPEPPAATATRSALPPLPPPPPVTLPDLSRTTRHVREGGAPAAACAGFVIGGFILLLSGYTLFVILCWVTAASLSKRGR